MDAAKSYDIGIRLRRLAAESQRVPHKVGYLLDSCDLVVVCENHGIAGALELHDFRNEVGRDGLHGCDDARSTLSNQAGSFALNTPCLDSGGEG